MTEIILPHNFTPREYQLPFFKAMDGGKKRAVLVHHRRAGKDKTCLNFVIKKMFERVGAYYYFFPTYSQGKKIMWDGADKTGFRFLDHFPKELVKSKNSTEMKIELVNGSIFQIIGTDNIDSVVGTNPVGCVFSEYSLQNPTAWDFMRPILAENGGWAVFNYTPRGKNHGFDLYEMAKGNPDWFCQRLTVDDTKIISSAVIDDERRSGMSEELIQQEYFCSFDSSVVGAFFSEQMALAEKEGRITKVPYEASLMVDTWWDLGIGDSTAIWFTQQLHNEIRVIDYLEANGESMNFYAQALKEKQYTYGIHHFPHDGRVRELSTGRTRQDFAEGLGIRPIDIVPVISIEDGINAVRMIFNRCWFDSEKCKHGIDALKNYHKDYDEKLKVFRSIPCHDWSSHGVDAFRQLAVSIKKNVDPNRKSKVDELMRKRIGRSRFSATI